MNEARFAHPVLDAQALGDEPRAVRLLGEDYVLWRDANGTPCAARDRCPHRGTKLSLGFAVHAFQGLPDICRPRYVE